MRKTLEAVPISRQHILIPLIRPYFFSYLTNESQQINIHNHLDSSGQQLQDQTHYKQNISPRDQFLIYSRDQTPQHVARPRNDSYQNHQPQVLSVNQYTNYGKKSNSGQNSNLIAIRDNEMQPNEGQFGEDHTRQISCSSGDSMPLFEHVSEREHITL